MIHAANLITISRIILILPILMLVSEEKYLSNWFALILFVLAGITDNLDGYIARKTGTESSMGALLDLIADKLLVVIIISYLVSFTTNKYLVVPAMIIIFRELVISALRQFLTEKKGSNPIQVSFLAKSKTTLQIVALSFLIISPNFGDDFYILTIFLFYLAAIASLYSLYGYIKNYKNYIK
ncbi:MAG: CDP-diacylglycerol--glycerol-3-phosphate 3-phosphatidyltransferase [Gammaproteobacteria bacterium]